MADLPALILLGGGGHAAVVVETARLAEMRVLGFLDDDVERSAMEGLGLRRLGAVSEASQLLAQQETRTALHAAVGDAAVRRRWMTMLSELPFATIAHPSSVISATAEIGGGAFFAPLSVVNARAIVEDGVIINTGAIVEHDCRLGDHVHVASGARLASAVHVGDDVHVGAGATILQTVSIGRAAVVGAGAVVLRDVEPGATVVGVPARPLER
jgi:sugar O-acyltransferase (sialic acid O-acetyltransferase NeuD family)